MKPDLDAIRANWRHDVAIGSDVPALLCHIDTLEHMLAEERENVDTLRARVAELETIAKPKRWKWGPNPESAFFAKAHVEAVECLTPEAKCDVREWRVRCLQCTRVFDMAERTIRNLGKRRYGCRGCYEDKVVTPRAERRRTRFFAKLASE